MSDGFSIPATASYAGIGLARAFNRLGKTDTLQDAVKATSQEDFASILARSSSIIKAKVKPEQAAEQHKKAARDAAEQFVAVAFVQPILKNLRSSSIGKELPAPWGPGNGEKQFRSIADTQVARQLVRANRWSVVDRIASDLRGGTPRTLNKLHPHYTAAEIARAKTEPGSPADIKRISLEHARKLAAYSQVAPTRSKETVSK